MCVGEQCLAAQVESLYFQARRLHRRRRRKETGRADASVGGLKIDRS